MNSEKACINFRATQYLAKQYKIIENKETLHKKEVFH